MKKQYGATLVEVMLAMTFGLILIAAVVRLVAHTLDRDRLIAVESGMQETLHYLTQQLGDVLSSALSSPCGQSLDTFLSDDANTPSALQRAKLRGEKGIYPQLLPNVINTRDNSTGIHTEAFPLFAIGIAGHSNEPRNHNDVPFSQVLSNIVPDSQYLIVMDAAKPIQLRLGSDSSQGIAGGKNTAGALRTLSGQRIPTTDIDYRVGVNPVPHIITNCQTGDIFLPSKSVSKRGIPVDDNMVFSNVYHQDETVIYPVTLYAYYLSQPKHLGQRSWSRMNLSLTTTDNKPASQPLVGGVYDVQFTWGLGKLVKETDSDQGVRAFFTTQQVLDDGGRQGELRRRLISVHVTLTAQPYQLALPRGWKRNQVAVDNTSERRTVQRIYTLRHPVSR